MKDPGKRGDRERGPGRQGKRGIANSSMRCTCSLILRGAYYNNFFLLLVYVSSTSRTLHFQFNLININWMITVIVSVCVCLFGMRNVIVECVNIEHKHVHKIHICINIQLSFLFSFLCCFSYSRGEQNGNFLYSVEWQCLCLAGRQTINGRNWFYMETYI